MERTTRVISCQSFMFLGTWLIILGLIGSLMAVFLAIPPFSFGIWFQSEPVNAGLSICAAVVGCGLVIVVWADQNHIVKIIHPVVILPFLLVLISLATAPFHSFLATSWFGSPELGEGILYYLSFATLAAGALAIRDLKFGRYLITIVALSVTVAITTLTLANRNMWPPNIQGPYFFPDYLAFYGSFIPLVLVAAFNLKNGFAIAIACTMGAFCIYASENHGAMLLAFVVAPILFASLHFLRGKARLQLSLATLAAFLAPISITVCVLILGYIDANGILEGLPPAIKSMTSRYHLLKIIFSAIEANPLLALFGQGWGGFSDALAVNLPVEWLKLISGWQSSNTGDWDALGRVDFHSHNFYFESLLAVGFLGPLLALSLSGTLPLWSQKNNLPLVTVVAVLTGGSAALWFQMPASLPVMALAWAWSTQDKPFIKISKTVKYATLTTIIFASGAITLSGVHIVQFAKEAYYFLPSMDPPLKLNGKMLQCPKLLDDLGRRGDHLNHRLGTMSGHIVGAINDNGQISEQQAAYLRGLICATEQKIDEQPAFRILLSSLNTRADLAFAKESLPLTSLRSEYFTNWGQRIRQALHQAPRRADLATPYLLWLLNEGREKEFNIFAKWLYQQNPENLVGLWFSGMAQLSDPASSALGVERMKKALSGGVERFLPVEEEIKRGLLGSDYIAKPLR